jgi:ribose transport system ATP-binding protein
MADSLLSAAGLVKRFGTVCALDHVGLELRPGEIHALVGENGAGKSTLARILSGLSRADEGEIRLDRERYVPTGRVDAERLGVRIVLQELNLIPTLSVAENLFLRKMPQRLGFIDRRTLSDRAQVLLGRVGLADLDPSRPVEGLGIGARQMIEIASAFSEECKVLILDEPTAALADAEAERLFEYVLRLKAAGTAIVYVSHRMEEIRRLADRITVLRDGRLVDSRPAAELSLDDVIRLMVGREIGQGVWRAKEPGRVALRVSGLKQPPAVREVSLEVREGEIVGIAGLMGSGRTETLRALFGADRRRGGDVYLGDADRPARLRNTTDAVRSGVALLTEDRKDQGLLLSRPIRENVTLTHVRRFAAIGGLIRARREAAEAETLTRRLDVRCRSIEQTAGELSGGNQQKVVFAKWLNADCNVLLVDEPTRGVDVGAKFEIYGLLNELASQGKAVLMASSDLPELMSICDRILVMCRGRVTASFERGQWTADGIMAAAIGGEETRN